jgi:hypothetical protein
MQSPKADPESIAHIWLSIKKNESLRGAVCPPICVGPSTAKLPPLFLYKEHSECGNGLKPRSNRGALPAHCVSGVPPDRL